MPLIDQVYLGMQATGGKSWSPGSAVWNRVVQKSNDDRRDWREWSDETDLLFVTMTWKVMQKGSLRDTANWERRCILSSAGGDTLHKRSLDTTGRLWNDWKTLCCMFSNSSKMLAFGRTWTTRFTVVSKYCGKVSNNREQGLRQNIA